MPRVFQRAVKVAGDSDEVVVDRSTCCERRPADFQLADFLSDEAIVVRTANGADRLPRNLDAADLRPAHRIVFASRGRSENR